MTVVKNKSNNYLIKCSLHFIYGTITSWLTALAFLNCSRWDEINGWHHPWLWWSSLGWSSNSFQVSHPLWLLVLNRQGAATNTCLCCGTDVQTQCNTWLIFSSWSILDVAVGAFSTLFRFSASQLFEPCCISTYCRPYSGGRWWFIAGKVRIQRPRPPPLPTKNKWNKKLLRAWGQPSKVI